MNRNLTALILICLLTVTIVLGTLYYNLKKAYSELEKLSLTTSQVIETGYLSSITISGTRQKEHTKSPLLIPPAL